MLSSETKKQLIGFNNTKKNRKYVIDRKVFNIKFFRNSKVFKTEVFKRVLKEIINLARKMSLAKVFWLGI